jgi:excisionase family DNA binding protein
MNQNNFVVLTTPNELESLIQNAIKDALGNLQLQPSNQDIIQKDFLNIQEAAEFLNLAVPTIYGLVSKREIPSLKIGKKLAFKRLDLIALLETGRRNTKKELIALGEQSLKKTQKLK